MLFFMMALLPPTEIQSRALKVSRVGLPTCCSWNSAQFMEELPTIFIFWFPGKHSLCSTEDHEIPKQPFNTSRPRTQLHLSQHLKEIHYHCVNRNNSRKQSFVFLPCISLKPGHGAHTSRQNSNQL